jgi:periplasmic protein TonB
MEGFMLAYAPRTERRRFSPTGLALIVGVHAVAIIAVITAKMNLPEPYREPPIFVDSIELPPEPLSPEPQPKAPNPAPSPPISAPSPFGPLPPLPDPVVEPLPPQPFPGPTAGTGTDPLPRPAPIVRRGPRFTTPADAVRPPYPEAMRAAEKEAVLRLKLSIDERGRVIAVEPVGKAEPAFLAAARRHILKAWRYTPAMVGDTAVASTTTVTLEFKLDS